MVRSPGVRESSATGSTGSPSWGPPATGPPGWTGLGLQCKAWDGFRMGRSCWTEVPVRGWSAQGQRSGSRGCPVWRRWPAETYSCPGRTGPPRWWACGPPALHPHCAPEAGARPQDAVRRRPLGASLPGEDAPGGPEDARRQASLLGGWGGDSSIGVRGRVGTQASLRSRSRAPCTGVSGVRWGAIQTPGPKGRTGPVSEQPVSTETEVQGWPAVSGGAWTASGSQTGERVSEPGPGCGSEDSDCHIFCECPCEVSRAPPTAGAGGREAGPPDQQRGRQCRAPTRLGTQRRPDRGGTAGRARAGSLCSASSGSTEAGGGRSEEEKWAGGSLQGCRAGP